MKLGGLEGCEVQLAFAEERSQAAMLADKAVEAERKKNLGQALATWTELLDRFPYERKLVLQATEARGRLVHDGLTQVDDLRREMERARFFLLPELFRKGQERALALARQYQGSEVETEAKKTAQTCAMALAELTAGQSSDEALLLAGVLQALDPAQAPKLTEHVREALAKLKSAPAGPGGGAVDPDGKDD